MLCSMEREDEGEMGRWFASLREGEEAFLVLLRSESDQSRREKLKKFVKKDGEVGCAPSSLDHSYFPLYHIHELRPSSM